MPVPPSVTTRVVRGTYIDSAGTPRRGTITFRVDQPLIATVESWGVTPEPIVVTLSTSGTFQINLMASNDLDLFPSGFMYIVQERFQGGYVRTYRVEVPSSGDPLDLPTATQYDPGDVGLAVVHSVNGLTGIVQLTATGLGAVPLSQKGAANGVASLDSAGRVPLAQLPSGVGGVASVDGRTGAVTLTDLYSATGHTHSYVSTVNGKSGSAVTLVPGDLGAVSASLLGANSGVATLDSGGKVLGAQIPSLAIVDVFDASSQTAMLNTAAQKGDIVRRTDISATFVLGGNDPSVLSNWKQLPTPPSSVVSVNGQTGAVSFDADDIGALSTQELGAPDGVAELDSFSKVPLAQIPNLPGSQITSGLINFSRLPTGTTSTTVALGNHTHAYIPISEKGVGNGVATLDSGAKVPLSQLPAVATAVTSVNSQTGAVVLTAADVGALATSARGAASGVASLDSGTLVPVAQIPGLNASKITAGTIDIARLPIGSTSSTVPAGDHTHAYVPTSEKGVGNGVASLDSGAKVPFIQLPTGTTSDTVSVGSHAHTQYVETTQLGQADGVAELDSLGLLPLTQLPEIDAAKVTSGILTIGRIPTGSTSDTVALGNHTHGYIPTSERGAASGVAPLDADSRLPAANLTPFTLRGVVLDDDDPISVDMPVGSVVFRTSGTPWSGVVLEGLWDGDEVIPVTLAV